VALLSSRRATESLSCQRWPLFSWFLFLLGLVFLVWCCIQSSSTQWESSSLHEYYHRLLNQSRRVPLPPPYHVYPKHGLKPTEPSEGPERPAAPPPQYHPAYARNYHFIMDHPEVCRTRAPFLVLMVPVAPQNAAARDAIRQTWAAAGEVRGRAVLTLFMLGLSGGAGVQEELRREDLLHRDLLQSDFTDTYRNLTIKTMVIMDWLATRCRAAAYAAKVDSDMFLNVHNLVSMLQTPGVPAADYLTGMLMWNRPVVRSRASKWFVPEELYPGPRYPPYALGMAYVFSNDLPHKFVEVSKSIRAFNIEDAYIGECMKELGLAPAAPPDPAQFKAYSPRYDRCEYSKVITYILGSPEELLRAWKDLKKPGPPC